MEEIWKDIEGYEGLYQVSNLGRVKSLPRIAHAYNSRTGKEVSLNVKGKICTPHTEAHGYWRISLGTGGRGKQRGQLVHRLVAKAFIPNPDNLPFVNHKDENKKNNRVDNLEWCDNDYNVHYGTGLERRSQSQKKAVEQIDCQGNVVAVYAGVVEASEATGIERSAIGKCCNGIKNRKTAGGFKWKFID